MCVFVCDYDQSGSSPALHSSAYLVVRARSRKRKRHHSEVLQPAVATGDGLVDVPLWDSAALMGDDSVATAAAAAAIVVESCLRVCVCVCKRMCGKWVRYNYAIDHFYIRWRKLNLPVSAS